MTQTYRVMTKGVANGDEIELHDDVQILDSVNHGVGVKLTLLEPNGEYWCRAETSNGGRCERTVDYPTERCHQHK